MLDLLLGTLVLAVGLWLPGCALAAWALRERDPLALAVIGFGVGVFGMPMLHFGLAMLVGTNMTAAGSLGLGALVTAGAGTLARRQTAAAA
jgi:hypothetical protein